MEGGYFTERQRKIFRENPEVYDQFIKATEEIVNAKFKIVSFHLFFNGKANSFVASERVRGSRRHKESHCGIYAEKAIKKPTTY